MKSKSKVRDVVQRPIYRFDVMPTVLRMEQCTLADCVATVTKKDGFVVVTQNGEAVALIEPFDQEQFERGIDKEFWKWIDERRKRPTISSDELKRRLDLLDKKEKTSKNSMKAKNKKVTKAKKAVVK